MKAVFTGPVFSVESGVVKEPGGVRARRDVVRHSSSVAVLPVHPDGTITLIRQYRYAFRKRVIEIPAGRIDRGETPLQAAKRELREEIGLGARVWEKIVRMVPSPGLCDETVTIFRASDFFASFAEPDPDERIEVLRVSLTAGMRRLSRENPQDAKTLVALMTERRRRSEAPRVSAPSR